MSDDTPGDNEPQFPFGSMPFLNDMMKAMAAQGPLNWQIAAEAAASGARGDTPDPENDPSTRIALNRDRKSTRLNSSHIPLSRMPSSA